MEYLIEYGLFLAKAATVVAAIVLVIAAAAAAGNRRQGGRRGRRGRIKVTELNRHVDELRDALRDKVLSKAQCKQLAKAEKAERKKAAKEEKKRAKAAAGGAPVEAGKRLFVLRFKGDMAAEKVASLREEITAILSIAGEADEVLLCLESPGGMVHAYGLASSQLARIRKRGIPLTICVDKVAASGGYMMACLADKLIAAPFAIIGSIGVVLQLPNFHRVLRRNEIDYELITAGEFKRTLTVFGEVTDKARGKAQEDVDNIHGLFKNWVKEHRPAVDLGRIATGETWVGTQAMDLRLVDEIGTSDEKIVAACAERKVYEVEYVIRRPAHERLGRALYAALDRLLLKWSGAPPNTHFQ
ncbi:MAG: protease SohB [Gammaproteobacteria bacterium]|nr:protease SohB [Gammaproteobacteria bacterium]